MKKICFITTISATLKFFIVDTAKYLYENGEYDITLICDKDPAFAQTLPDYFKYIPVPMKRGISISGLGALVKLFVIFKKEQFDLVQYSTPNAAFYASVAAKLAGVPVRLYCQWGMVYVGFVGLKRTVLKALEKLACSFSTRIEPDSFGNLDFGRLEGLYSTEKSLVVGNGSAGGVNLKKFDIAAKEKWRQEIRSKYGIAEGIFVMGFVGRITGDKGINELYAASKRFFTTNPESVLMLVGSPEKFETINQELYQWSREEQRVIYCGGTMEVEKYFAAMDVFVLPSYREGFGSVVIEAEAMGVPVIVTDIPGPIEAMAPNKTGLVIEKQNELSLCAALDEISRTGGRRKLMGELAVSFVMEKFDAEKLWRAILQDRDFLLKQSSRRLKHKSEVIKC
jgi:glycosyltransferase involved in cell wall biosynthesis